MLLQASAEPDRQIETRCKAPTRPRPTSKRGLRDITAHAKPDDSVIVMMIGHGTYDNIGLQVQPARARI